jgi:thiol-disulfide isomerase/thioredoxin
LAERFGVTRYPAIFVDEILVAKPKDFGFYGKGEGGGNGRYTPWKDPGSHERFRADLKRMIDTVLSGNADALKKERSDETAVKDITELPSISVTDLAGKTISNEALKGRPVLIEFWATWCPPCRGTLAWLGDLKKRYGDRLTIVAVAIESDEAEVRKLTAQLNLPLSWVMGSPDLALSFGDVSAVPMLFLFDAYGRIIESFYGAPPDLHQNVEKALTTAKPAR